jgi:multidrug efflux system membrane fusion protein
VLGAVLAVLATASCGKKEEPHPEAAPAVVRGVKVEALQLTTATEEYEAVGTVRSVTTTVLSAQVVGSVVALHVREGDRVRAGQLLLEIDARDSQTRVDKARAGLREAEQAVEEVERGIRAAEAGKAGAEANWELASSTYNRFKGLAERGSVSQQEFDEVRAKFKAASSEVERATEYRESLLAKRRQVLARMDQAKADIAGAQIAVGYSRLTSPVAGLVTARQADVGSLAAPGVPLLTVEDDSRFRLEAAVEESRIGRIRVGDRARARLDALGGVELQGWVAELVPASDPATRTYIVKIGLEPPKGARLRSGLFGRALFRMGEEKVLAVDRRAIVERGQLMGVYAVDSDSTARLRLIRTGKPYGNRIEVLSGLNAGDRVVVEGAERVTDGAKVEVISDS